MDLFTLCPNQGQNDSWLKPSLQHCCAALLPFYRKDETEARRYACVNLSCQNCVAHLSKKQASPLVGTKADSDFPFPHLGVHWGPSFQDFQQTGRYKSFF